MGTVLSRDVTPMETGGFIGEPMPEPLVTRGALSHAPSMPTLGGRAG